MNAQLDLLSQPRMFPVERQLGIERAAAKAERSAPRWIDTAADYLAAFAKVTACRCAFLVEDAIVVAPSHLKPDNPKAWGAAVLLAKKRGAIAHAKNTDGSTMYGTGRVNASPKPMWVAA